MVCYWSGAKPKEVSKTLNIAQSTVHRNKNKRDETGSVVDGERGGRLVSVVTRKLENAVNPLLPLFVAYKGEVRSLFHPGTMMWHHDVAPSCGTIVWHQDVASSGVI